MSHKQQVCVILLSYHCFLAATLSRYLLTQLCLRCKTTVKSIFQSPGEIPWSVFLLTNIDWQWWRWAAHFERDEFLMALRLPIIQTQYSGHPQEHCCSQLNICIEDMVKHLQSAWPWVSDGWTILPFLRFPPSAKMILSKFDSFLLILRNG